MNKDDYKRIFAKNLKQLLYDRGLTQREFAEKTGITEGGVSRYIRGERSPQISQLYTMSRALRCTTDELIMEKPVGYWVTVLHPQTEDVIGWRCSVCGKLSGIDWHTDFCPICGADMRGNVND